MKYKPIKFRLLISLLLLLLNLITSLKSKSKSYVSDKSKNHLKLRKEELSLKGHKLTITDGPISWEDLSEQAFQNLIESQTQNFTKENNDPPGSMRSFEAPVTSQENQETKKSITFRTVSPNEDTTVNSQGQKYSTLIGSNIYKNLKAGFMGGSRLTRF